MALTNKQLQGFKDALLQERTRLIDDRDSYARASRDDTPAGASGELSAVDPSDPGDEGTQLFDRDRDIAAFEVAARLLAKVDRALAKIDEGTYGRSDVDGSEIPIERLEAVPYAVTTVEQEEAL